MQLCLIVTLLRVVHLGERLGQYKEPRFGLSSFSLGLGQQGKIIWSEGLRACGPQGGRPLADLRHAFCPCCLCSQCPAPQTRSYGESEGKTMLNTVRHLQFRLAVVDTFLSAILCGLG